MNKKNYFIIGGTILFFLIIIILILTKNDNKINWTKEILESTKYEITMTDCNGREIILPKETVKEIFNKWDKLSDNGPWTGDNTKCYKTATITFEKEGIVQSREILLLNNSELAVNLNEGYRYYTNSTEINKYLNELFNTY